MILLVIENLKNLKRVTNIMSMGINITQTNIMNKNLRKLRKENMKDLTLIAKTINNR